MVVSYTSSEDQLNTYWSLHLWYDEQITHKALTHQLQILFRRRTIRVTSATVFLGVVNKVTLMVQQHQKCASKREKNNIHQFFCKTHGHLGKRLLAYGSCNSMFKTTSSENLPNEVKSQKLPLSKYNSATKMITENNVNT